MNLVFKVTQCHQFGTLNARNMPGTQFAKTAPALISGFFGCFFVFFGEAQTAITPSGLRVRPVGRPAGRFKILSPYTFEKAR